MGSSLRQLLEAGPAGATDLLLSAAHDAQGRWRWMPAAKFAAQAAAAAPLALRCARGARLDDARLEHIARVRTLEALNLTGGLSSDRPHPGLGSLAALHRLHELTFGAERCGGDSWIVDDDLDLLANISSLRVLRLHHSWAVTDDGLARLAPLEGLRRLDLDGCRRVTGRGLCALPRLEHVVLSGCAAQDDALAGLAPLPGLDSLVLDRNRALQGPGLTHLTGLSRLRRLSLNRCTSVAEQHLRHLHPLAALRQLDLGGLTLSDAGLAGICRLRALRSLRVNANIDRGWIDERISDAGLAPLSQLAALERLELEVGCGVTDAGLDHLAGLPRLREVSLNYTAVTPDGVARLERAIPGLKVRFGANIEDVEYALGRYFGD